MDEKQQSFVDLWGRLWKIFDEEFDITQEDVRQWDLLVKTNPLPLANYEYTTFIHPEAGV